MNNTEKLVNSILESYGKDESTRKLDSDRTLNKDLIIEIVETLRKILFPGFFHANKVTNEYIKYIVGKELEFVEYNLKKQIAGVIGCGENCINCEKSVLLEKAEKITNDFLFISMKQGMLQKQHPSKISCSTYFVAAVAAAIISPIAIVQPAVARSPVA